jgi:hypothetical protein
MLFVQQATGWFRPAPACTRRDLEWRPIGPLRHCDAFGLGAGVVAGIGAGVVAGIGARIDAGGAGVVAGTETGGEAGACGAF